MIRPLAAVMTLALAGCGVAHQPTKPVISGAERANLAARPRQDAATTPYVEFAGDDQAMGEVAWVNQQGNSLWKCTICEQGQTSDQIVAKVDQLKALHPQVVVLWTGAYDIQNNPREPNTIANIQTIFQQLNAVGIPVIICLLPPSEDYDSYYLDFEIGDSFEAPTIYPWVNGNDGNAVANLGDIIPDLTDKDEVAQVSAGIDLTPDGYMLVYPILYDAVESFAVGGAR